MKTNFIIMALVATSTNAIQLKFTPLESTDNGSILSETMKSLKESEQITGSQMETPTKAKDTKYDGIGSIKTIQGIFIHY